MYGKGFARVGGTSLFVHRLASLTAAMRDCDASLEGHASRVGSHAEAVARRLEWSDDRLEVLRLGAALHDVGKVNIPPGLLQKPGRLDADELAAIRAHPVEGAWMIAGIPAFGAALPYVLFHHERWDGGGYPTGRAGTDIPLEGRLLAVADAFDAMTSLRPYRDRLSSDEAAVEVERCAGSQFDPTLAEVFVDGVLRRRDQVEASVAVAV